MQMILPQLRRPGVKTLGSTVGTPSPSIIWLQGDHLCSVLLVKTQLLTPVQMLDAAQNYTS